MKIKGSKSELQQTLERLLEERKMSLLALSKKSKVSRSTISGWLHGSRPRKLHELKRVSDALGVSFELLCLGQEDADLGKALSQASRRIEIEGLYYVRLERLVKE